MLRIKYFELIAATEDQEITTPSSSRNEISGRLLLEDNFDFLNASIWKREIKMPLDPVSIVCPLFVTELLKVQ